MHTLEQLADLVDGQTEGDGSVKISGVRPFEDARPGDITLAAAPRYWNNLKATRATAVIAPSELQSASLPLLRTADPMLAFARVISLFHTKPFLTRGISSQAEIGEDCSIAERVSIHPFVSIGEGVTIEEEVTLHSGVSVGDGCRIGTGTTLHPNVVIYPGVHLGRRVIIHGGSVIGADGFGYVFDGEKQVKIEQTGTVEIQDDVEIGANSCVDRATFGSTVVEKHAKLDNHVHVGHNSRIGENTVVVGCIGISGSVNIGKNCILAGQAGVIDHINIGDGVTVMVKTAVTRDIPSNTTISGQPGRDHREQLQIQAVIRKLPEMYKDWKKLKSLLAKSAD